MRLISFEIPLTILEIIHRQRHAAKRYADRRGNLTTRMAPYQVFILYRVLLFCWIPIL